MMLLITKTQFEGIQMAIRDLEATLPKLHRPEVRTYVKNALRLLREIRPDEHDLRPDQNQHDANRNVIPAIGSGGAKVDDAWRELMRRR
jgi:hypothetical protein